MSFLFKYRKIIFIALAFVAVVTFVVVSYKSAVKSAYKLGRADYRSEMEAQYRAQLSEAMKQAEADWIAANAHVETVVKTETKIKEVARDVVRTVTVTECDDLGSEWLHNYNAVIAADANDSQGSEGAVREASAVAGL